MILAAAYIVGLFHLPAGHQLQIFGSIGSPVGLTTLIVAVIGIVGMFVPCYLGIKFGARFAAVMGIASMVPLTLFILLPVAHPSKFHCPTSRDSTSRTACTAASRCSSRGPS